MKVHVKDKIVGDTFKATWVSSGAAPATLSSAIFDATGTLVSSLTPVSSGNGFFYALHQLPNTPGVFENVWNATVTGGLDYVSRQIIRTHDVMVD